MPSPLGSLAPRFCFFFPSLAGLNDPAPHPAPAADSSGWNSFQVTRRELWKRVGKGWVEKKGTEQGRKRPKSRGLMLMYHPACVLLPQSSDSSELGVAPVVAAPPLKADAGTASPKPSAGTSGLDDLDLLGKALLQQSLPPESQQVRW